MKSSLHGGYLKHWAILAISLLWGLSACAPATQFAPPPVLANIVTPSPILTNTSTSIPTGTLTPSITPLPTISTFTPTFDARTVLTVTPAPKAECPQEDPSVVAKFAIPNSDGSYEPYPVPEVLDYLNAGGTLDGLQQSSLKEIADLTGDGVNEVGYGDFIFGYSIFGCKDGHYQDLLDFTGDFGVYLADVVDLNKNGIPEIILYNVIHYGYVDISIFEWDGNKFHSLIDMGKYSSTDDTVVDWVSATDYHKLIDTNGDGLKEIVIVYDVQETESWGLGVGEFVTMRRPLRNITTILGWNGKNFVDLKQGSYPPPDYRFQAVQDGDEQVRYGNYAAALSLYQAAIFDDRLEWWSPARREYEIHIYMSRLDATPTIYPTPVPDNTEYARLAAYAYFRIMLLHIVQGHESDAGTVYKTLGQKFSHNSYGHPYYEMASAFWDAYQSMHNMYDGCAAAIEYAAEHLEILSPLGSDYHGGYSHTYVPEDMCPFR
ncbi:MAG TPA: hypothetical protein VK249_07970 [Anaerolineales bacterium]|nr:hypothetical protein [Anaerolineales bacterium]